MQYHLPTRKKDFHKGEKGKVIIIGGSAEYYGAPILSAMGAEKSGADLITLMIPGMHVEAAKSYSLNFFLKSFSKNILSLEDVDEILKLSKQCNALLIGPGIGSDTNSQQAITVVLQDIDIPVVIDAQGLFSGILPVLHKICCTITPHKREFKNLFGCDASDSNISKMSKKYKVQILVKGHVDIISDKGGSLSFNNKGCPEMRVGGTGDALAGIITSWIAQGMTPDDACKNAVFFLCAAAESLRLQTSYFSSYDLVSYFPEFLADF